MNRQDLINYRDNIAYLDQKFENIMRRRERLFKITPSYEESSHVNSAIQDKFAEKLAKILDDEMAYYKLVEEKLNKMKKIEIILDTMENTLYRNILYNLYINEKKYNLTQVANLIDKEYTYVCKLHGEALNEFDKQCEIFTTNHNK
jgi:Ribonuclease G/E